MFQELIHSQANVLGDLANEYRRDIAAGVKRNRSRPTVRMAKLLVRTALPYFGEAKREQDGDNFSRLQDRHAARLSDKYGLSADEFGFQLGIAVFQEHGDHLAQVRMQLVERRPLAMCAAESRHIADVQLSRRAVLDHRGIGMHSANCSAPRACM